MDKSHEQARITRERNKAHKEQMKAAAEVWEAEQIAALKRIVTSKDSTAQEVLAALDKLKELHSWKVAQVK